jgi:hypothetical protein
LVLVGHRLPGFHEILQLETPPLAAGRKAGFREGFYNSQLMTMPNSLGEKGFFLEVLGDGSAPARGWGESPILGIELGAEYVGAKLRRTSDGRVY